MKTYLNTSDNLIKAYQNCEDFRLEVNHIVYEGAQESLSWEIEDFNVEGLRWHGHYCSFFCTVENRDEFLDSVLWNDNFLWKINFSDEEIEKVKKAYTHFKYEMSYDNKRYDDLDSWLDKKAEELKNEYESELHSIEKLSDDEDYILEWLCEVLRENYKDYFVIDNDFSMIFNHQKAHYIPAADVCVFDNNRYR